MDIEKVEKAVKGVLYPCKYLGYVQTKSVKIHCLSDMDLQELYSYANYLGVCPQLVRKILTRVRVKPEVLSVPNILSILNSRELIEKIKNARNIDALFTYKVVDYTATETKLTLSVDRKSELVQKEVEACMNAPKVKPPEEIEKVLMKLKKTVKAGINLKEIPPCIKLLAKKGSTEHHLTHKERLALATYLLCKAVLLGSSPKEAVEKAYKVFEQLGLSDFNPKVTRYQLEHLIGLRGGRHAYLPPKCETLKELGACPGCPERYMDKLVKMCYTKYAELGLIQPEKNTTE